MKLFFIGLAAFIGGALISWGNYLLLRLLMKRKGESGITLISPVRTVMSAAYLVALYLLGKHAGLNSTALLIGGALGLTAALVFFTFRLTRGLQNQRKE